jgi:hypothetical protein
MPLLSNLLLRLEVIQQHASLLALLTPISDDDAAAVDDLPGIPLAIQHTQAGPFAQHLSIRDLDQGDLVLLAEGDDEFLVGFFFAGFVEDTHVGLAAVEGFGGFAQAAGETVVDEGNFEDACCSGVSIDPRGEPEFGGTSCEAVMRFFIVRTFQSIEHTHGATGSSSISSNLNLIGGGDGGSGLFSVRLYMIMESAYILSIISCDRQASTAIVLLTVVSTRDHLQTIIKGQVRTILATSGYFLGSS